MKLSFAGVSKLRHDYHEWLNGSIAAGYEHFQRDLITFDTLLLKTHADEYRWAEPDAYSDFERGLATGDSNSASEKLRRFFEQRFHEGSDSSWFAPTRTLEPLPHALPSTRACSSSQVFD
jgi:anaphase-promoting complex subunit 5